jgi:kumamolisin
VDRGSIGAAVRAGVAIVVVGCASTVVPGQGPSVAAAAAAAAAARGPARSSDLGVLLGPTHAPSVSFLVLLRAAAQPTCLTQWAQASGLTVRWSPGQRWVTIAGAPRHVDHSFHVLIDDYRTSAGQVVFAADHPAAVPTGVCGEVAGVGTIHSFVRPSPFAVPASGLTSVDLLRAYGALPLTQKGYGGQGETVVLMEGGGFLRSDLTTFASDENLPPVDLTLVGKNTGFDDETTLDIETVYEIVPRARLVFFNLNSIPDATSDADLFAQAFLKAEARFPGAVMSLSLGVCETDTEAFDRADLVALNSAVASIEAKGSTVFASSGDAGGLDCTPSADDGQPPQSTFEGVTVPASLPAVTGTGGTTLTTDAAGDYGSETTWSEPLLSQGTGGGVSAVFARPSWQTGVGTGGQTDAGNGRQVPDVSADSDPTTGNLIIEKGQKDVGGGTSLAAPIWAGFTAIMDQYLEANHDRAVGFFNPILYRLTNAPVPYPPFHDVTVGGNDFYAATPGYDMTTGLGSPNVYNLARDLKAGGF